MKLKKKKLSISGGYEVQIYFFLKILDQFARQSFNSPARKTPWSQFEQAQDLAKDTSWRTTYSYCTLTSVMLARQEKVKKKKFTTTFFLLEIGTKGKKIKWGKLNERKLYRTKKVKCLQAVQGLLKHGRYQYLPLSWPGMGSGVLCSSTCCYYGHSLSFYSESAIKKDWEDGSISFLTLYSILQSQ